MIDENKTFKNFGYTSDTLSHGSNKKVLCVCDECGKERLIEYKGYRNLCKSCSRIGKHISEKTKNKISKANTGKHHSEETKLKISKAHSGKNNLNFEKFGDKNSSWKGGKKLSVAKSHTKRRELFGFIPHNKPQKDFHGHHLDFNHVIFIPKELHTRMYHSVVKNINMNLINNLVCDWYLKY